MSGPLNDDQWPPIETPGLDFAYPELATVDRPGPPIPTTDACCGFVAVPRRFPQHAPNTDLQDIYAHLYNKLYPDQLQQDPHTGKWDIVAGTGVSIRNEPALARSGAQRFVIIQPRCMDQLVDDNAYYELTTLYACARGAVACPKCWPEAWGNQDGWIVAGYTDGGRQWTFDDEEVPPNA